MKKIIAKKIRTVINENGNLELTLEIDNYRFQQLAKELEKDKDYNVEFKEPKSKRSIQQNKYMWALLKEIADETGVTDEFELYLQFLEIANAKFDYIVIDPRIVESVRPMFRGMKFVRAVEIEDLIKHEYKVFLGSSTFSKQEMNELLEVILKYAYEIGVKNYEFYYQNLM